MPTLDERLKETEPETATETIDETLPTNHADAAAFKGKIIVVVPVRNEGPEIVRTIRDLRKSRAPGTNLHFFVVDDSSTDGCCKTLPNAPDITLTTNSKSSNACSALLQGS